MVEGVKNKMLIQVNTLRGRLTALCLSLTILTGFIYGCSNKNPERGVSSVKPLIPDVPVSQKTTSSNSKIPIHTQPIRIESVAQTSLSKTKIKNKNDIVAMFFELPLQKQFELKRIPAPAAGLSVKFDPSVSANNKDKGALKIRAENAGGHRIQLQVVSVEPMKKGAKIACRANMMTQQLKGSVYLELVPTRLEKSTSAMVSELRDTSTSPDWTILESAVFVKADMPAIPYKMNVVLDGTGTIWLDNVQLLAH